MSLRTLDLCKVLEGDLGAADARSHGSAKGLPRPPRPPRLRKTINIRVNILRSGKFFKLYKLTRAPYLGTL